jgi:subtilisin-like proprotein convertase family protein
VQELKVGINISHTFVGDLRVEPLSPTDRRATMHPRLGGARHDLVMTYDSSSPSSALAALVGQTIAGNWILRVSDLAGRDVGMLNRWSIEAVAA